MNFCVTVVSKRDRKIVNAHKNKVQCKPGTKYVSRCPMCVGNPAGYGVQSDYTVNPLAKFACCRVGHKWALRTT